MSISPLPLSYCTNVHPGTTIAEVEAGLRKFTVVAKEKFGSPLAAGLWLAAPVIREFQAWPETVTTFAKRLQELGLPCYTLNAFPYGDFHSSRVKENVYIPDWTRPERLEYTVACAQVLTSLLPSQTEGSISTVPLGFKNLVGENGASDSDFIDRCLPPLVELARRMRVLEEQTEKRVRIAIEPEPLCVLETTEETLNFFRRLWAFAARSGDEDVVRRYLGICYDVCHQAVEFEDVPASIRAIDAVGLRINKLHISCAIHLANPRDEDARRELARYVEPRYLHQTMARGEKGTVLKVLDLSPELTEHPPTEFLRAEAWRVHFHVPVNAETLGPLQTTRPELKQALGAVAKLSYAPHLEVETYTWRVMPGVTVDLAQVLANELSATRELLREISC